MNTPADKWIQYPVIPLALSHNPASEQLICLNMSVPIYFPIAMPLSDKSGEKAIKAYLQREYATLVSDNGREFKNKLFQKEAQY